MNGVLDGTLTPTELKRLHVMCHASPVCPRPAVAWVRRPGAHSMWLPTCLKCVGPWTIQGADYRGPVRTEAGVLRG